MVGEISQWGLGFFGEWARIYFSTRNLLSQHAQHYTFNGRDAGCVCSCAEGVVYDRQPWPLSWIWLGLWEPFKTPFLWNKPAVWPMVSKGLKDTQRRWSPELSHCVSKLHTALSTHKDLLKIYSLTKFVWNLVAMNECIHLTKAILPWSPKSGLLLQGISAWDLFMERTDNFG